MSDVQRVIIVDPVDDSREVLKRTLLTEQSIWLEAECRDFSAFPDLVADTKPDVAILAIDSDVDDAVYTLQQVVANYPQVGIVALSSQTDGRFILDLIRKGVKEFVSLPLQPFELVEALRRVGGGSGTRRESRVIAFTGARGGVGSTSLAINAGCILAQDTNRSVALVDLDLVLGDVDVCLDIIPDYSIGDLAMSIDNADQMLVKRALAKHTSGLAVLPHPAKMVDAVQVQPESLERALTLLRRTFTHTILDLSKSFQPNDFTAMNLADEVVMVIQLDVSCLHNTLRFLQAIEERQSLLDKIRIVANRVGSDGEIPVSKAEETLKRTVSAQIPNDSKTMFASRNKGVPLLEFAPRSKIFQAIQHMCEVLDGRTGSKSTQIKPKRGFFG